MARIAEQAVIDAARALMNLPVLDANATEEEEINELAAMLTLSAALEALDAGQERTDG